MAEPSAAYGVVLTELTFDLDLGDLLNFEEVAEETDETDFLLGLMDGVEVNEDLLLMPEVEIGACFLETDIKF